MATTGHSISPTAASTAAASNATDMDKILANKVRTIEKKVASLDSNAVETDDINTEAALNDLER
jgi:hypothetical protein